MIEKVMKILKLMMMNQISKKMMVMRVLDTRIKMLTMNPLLFIEKTTILNSPIEEELLPKKKEKDIMLLTTEQKGLKEDNKD
jgi:hypothetical protein